MLDRLEELSNLFGPSGNEQAVRAYIKARVPGEKRTDAMGNLYVHKPGPGPRVMFAAHMDEVGMLVRGINELGLICYDQSGIDPRVVVGARVVVGEQHIPGVIGAKAIHLQSNEEFKKAYKHDQLYVDIGAKDKADAEKYVSVGDMICFDTKFTRFGDGLFCGKALDDRAGCAVLMELLKGDYGCDFHAVFTVQEEVGMRGATITAYNVRPQLAVMLEGTTANDMPKTEKGYVTRVGEGPAITFMNRGVIVPERMLAALKDCAKSANIPWQLRRGTTGGTDDGEIHKALSGCVTAGISLPCRYIHSPNSVASERDFEGMLRLAQEFLSTNRYEEVL